ncbi:MAG: efflux RND transporter permease subunit [Myxococcales bacterium]|nr:efflux RND transporter permease subunit [Myxococcales bacterium]
MTITRWAIQYTRVGWVTILILLVAGLLAYGNLPKAQDPGFTLRIATVTTVFPGASADRVEQLITSPVEEALQEIPEIVEITSVSRSGISVVTVEIEETIDDLEPVFTSVRDEMDAVTQDLPEDALDPEVNTDVAEVFGVLLAITSEGFDHLELIDAAQQLKNALLIAHDAASVEVYGEQERQIVLEFDPHALARRNVSPEWLIGSLQGANIVSPGGQVRVGTEMLSVEPSGSFASVDDIVGLVVRMPDGTLQRMGDLVQVRDTFESPSAPTATYDGQSALMLGVSMRGEGNSERFGASVREQIAAVQASLPLGLEIRTVAFQPDDVARSIGQFTSSLGQSVAIVFVVILLFLGVRTGSVVASTIPLVILATFLIMGWSGTGIDQMSLAALLIALGMLVDNAIVMSETTLVRVQQGESLGDAVVAASGELWIPLLISSLTTCAAFLPVYLAPGNASEFVGPIFLVVTMALMSSWLVAMTLLPLLLTTFLATPDQADADVYDSAAYTWWRNVLRGALRHRAGVLAGAVGLLAIALVLFGQVESEFFAPSDNPTLSVSVSMPESLTQTEATAAFRTLDRFVEDELRVTKDNSDGLVHYGSMLGSALPRFVLGYSGPDRSTGSIALLATTSDRTQVDVLADRIIRFVEENLVDARVEAGPLSAGPGGGADVGITLAHPDQAVLMNAAEAVMGELRSIDGVRNVRNDWGPRIKKLGVDVDPVRLRLARLTHQNVATSLLTSLDTVEASELRQGDDRTPIVVRSTPEASLDLAALRNLTVFGSEGSAALQQVADVSITYDFPAIRRVNRLRTVEVTADVIAGTDRGEVQRTVEDWLSEQALPVKVDTAGEQASSSEATSRLLANVPIAALAIVLLLILQFNSFRRMAANVAVLPFSLVGVVAALLLLGAKFGFIAVLALVSLFGIVLNNGIVLIDRIDFELAAGRAPVEALVEASVRRARPILLTTLTTTAGLIPLYLGGGAMFEGMAVTLIGGLVGGTALTLVLVPVLYSLLFRIDTRPDQGAARLDPKQGKEKELPADGPA